MREVESSVWLVQFSEPVEANNGRTWNRNSDLLVVAPSMESALAGVREAHPEATMHGVHRRGTNKTLFVVEAVSETATAGQPAPAPDGGNGPLGDAP